MPVAGRPLVAWSLDAFAACESVGSIVVAVPPSGSHPDIRQVGPGEIPTATIAGGETRAESVSNALSLVETDLVAIHDAARPLITPELVDAVVTTLEASPDAAGAIAAAPVTDTVKQVADSSRPTEPTTTVEKMGLAVESTLDRGRLWAAQTPQVFRTAALREALDVDAEIRDAATDEAMLVEAAGGTVLLHAVGGANLKVTTPDDLRVAEMHLIR